MPLAKALAVVWPFETFACYRCSSRRRQFRRSPGGFLAAVTLVVIGAVFVHGLVCIILGLGGYQFEAYDSKEIFERVPAGLACPNCGDSKISRSLHQPFERAVWLVNPRAPYRCWTCWNRMWWLKTWRDLTLVAIVWLAVLGTIGHGLVSYRNRQVDMLGLVGDELEKEREWFLGSDLETEPGDEECGPADSSRQGP